MSRPALLDVNVLLALFDPNHVHHEIAHDWFADHHDLGWVTCPLTENGFLRTANVARRGEFVPVRELVDHLRRFQSSGHNGFWPDDISLMNDRLFQAGFAVGHQQLTDVYMLGLAVTHDGCLVTFDHKIPLAAVKGARPEHLVVLGAAEEQAAEKRGTSIPNSTTLNSQKEKSFDRARRPSPRRSRVSS